MNERAILADSPFALNGGDVNFNPDNRANWYFYVAVWWLRLVGQFVDLGTLRRKPGP